MIVIVKMEDDRMDVVFVEDYEAMSRRAAEIVAGQIRQKPDSVLGLATGSTPLGLYRLLCRWYAAGRLDFSAVTTFNLDEYIGLSPTHPQSYHAFKQEHLFSKVNLCPARCFLPDGMAGDVLAEAGRYDARIEAAGGIDLQVLGIGRNGHIGFNEPDDHFAVRTHRVHLRDDTIQANARFFPRLADVPREAISVGMGAIMKAQHVVLLASGSDKAEAVHRAVCGVVTPRVPASILQLHRAATVLVDADAAALVPEKWRHAGRIHIG